MVFILTRLQHEMHGMLASYSIKAFHTSRREFRLHLRLPKPTKLCPSPVLKDEVDVLAMLLDFFRKPIASGFLVVSYKKRVLRLHKLSNILQFLSVIEISVKEDELEQGVFTISTTATSASILPVWFPFAFLIGYALVWLPFPDFGQNDSYLRLVGNLLLESCAQPDSGVAKIKALDKVSHEKKESKQVWFFQKLPSSFIFFFCFIITPILSALLVLIFATPSVP